MRVVRPALKPTEKPFIVVSDTHLGAVPLATERRFREFLDYAASEASGLLINGDLFEFGIAYRSVVLREHVRVLARLADLVESGFPVYFVAGNHDYPEWYGHVLRDDVGLTLLPDPVVMEIAGRRVLITHGDAVGQRSIRSRIERRLVGSRAAVAFVRLFHPDWIAWLQPYTTTTRRQVRRHSAGQGGGRKTHAPRIEAWARGTLQEDSTLDLVIAGHAHLPAREEVEPGRFYLNAGDWITHFTYVTIPVTGAPELRQWIEGSAEHGTGRPRARSRI